MFHVGTLKRSYQNKTKENFMEIHVREMLSEALLEVEELIVSSQDSL